MQVRLRPLAIAMVWTWRVAIAGRPRRDQKKRRLAESGRASAGSSRAAVRFDRPRRRVATRPSRPIGPERDFRDACSTGFLHTFKQRIALDVPVG